jgi:hypothetical protein
LASSNKLRVSFSFLDSPALALTVDEGLGLSGTAEGNVGVVLGVVFGLVGSSLIAGMVIRYLVRRRKSEGYEPSNTEMEVDPELITQEDRLNEGGEKSWSSEAAAHISDGVFGAPEEGGGFE